MAPKYLCLYHKECPDGFAAAWAVWKRAVQDGIEDQFEFAPAQYQMSNDAKFEGKHVILVDFSFKADEMRGVSSTAESVLVLDHHESAKNDLAHFIPDGLDPKDVFANWVSAVREGGGRQGRVLGVFDMKKSGARLAWEFFHPEKPVPQLIEYVEDRDLWKKELQHTEEINRWIMSFEHRFEEFSKAAAMLEDPKCLPAILTESTAIDRSFRRQMQKTVPEVQRTMTICGHTVPVANMPHFMASDAARHLSRGAPFVAIYFDGPTGRKFSLRVPEGDFDVQEIAVGFGGGGHKAAASFMAPHGWEGDGTNLEFENGFKGEQNGPSR